MKMRVEINTRRSARNAHSQTWRKTESGDGTGVSSGTVVVTQACSHNKDQLAEGNGLSEILWFYVAQVIANKLHPPDALLDAVELNGCSGGVSGLGIAAKNGSAGASVCRRVEKKLKRENLEFSIKAMQVA